MPRSAKSKPTSSKKVAASKVQTQPQTHHPERIGDEVIRALACLSVIAIHFQSSLRPSPYFNGAEWQWLAVAIDQFSRMCVPLFVALSGYGLSQKYSAHAFGLWDFLSKRVWRLLPAYFLWSAIFYVALGAVPSWGRSSLPFVTQLIYGRADYHLYFISMIFQFYLLFPIIWWVYQRWPKALLVGSGVFQVWWFWFLTWQESHPISWLSLNGDQEQYVWSLTWIWYFVLGLSLPKVVAFLQKRHSLGWLLTGAAVLAWIGLSWSTLGTVRSGVDPIIATRFTRYEVLGYGTLAAAALTWLAATKITWAPRLVRWFGRYSYVIYLSHTLWLRILFTFLWKQ